MTESGKKITMAVLAEKFEKLTSTVNLSQEKLDKKLSSLMDEVKEVRKSQEFLSERYDEMEKEIAQMKKSNKDLQEENKALKENVNVLKQHNGQMEMAVNSLEQYSRRCCLQFQGIPYKSGESTDQLVVNLARQTGAEISTNDISISHRLAPSSPAHPNPPIIAKFLSQKLRDEIYSRRRKLREINNQNRGQPMQFINESLTKFNKEIFKSCLSFKKQNRIKYIWTKHGVTFLKRDDDCQAVPIKSLVELKKLEGHNEVNGMLKAKRLG